MNKNQLIGRALKVVKINRLRKEIPEIKSKRKKKWVLVWKQ